MATMNAHVSGITLHTRIVALAGRSIQLLLLTFFAHAQSNLIGQSGFGDTPILQSATIEAIAEDHFGFLWIATKEGLVRFDGYRSRLFRRDSEDAQLGPGSDVVSLTAGSRGQTPVLWIGTRTNGLYMLDLESGRILNWHHVPDDSTSLVSNWVNVIHEETGEKGVRLWIGTNGSGPQLFLVEEDRFASLEIPASEWPDRTNSLVLCMRSVKSYPGTLWIGTRTGLYAVDQKNMRVHPDYPCDNNALRSNRITAICDAGNGQLWLGVWGAGLVKYDPRKDTATIQRFDPGDDDQPLTIEAIARRRDGKLWICTFNAGLKLFDPASGSFHAIFDGPDFNERLNSLTISNIFCDRRGTWWAGTHSGLIRVPRRPDNFRLISHDPSDINSLDNPYVWSISASSSGDLWVGTSSGLNRIAWPSGDVKRYRHNPGANPGAFVAHAILDIFEDKEDQLWLGTFGAGLFRYDIEAASFRRWSFSSSEDNNEYLDMIYSIAAYQDSDRLWLATEAGLRIFDPRSGAMLLPPAKEEAPELMSQINTIKRDARGRLWIGTLQSGLSLWQSSDSTFQRWQHRPEDDRSISANSVTAIAGPLSTAEDVIWVGTENAGLNRIEFNVPGEIEEYEITRIDHTRGFHGISVLRIEADREKNLWVSTESGLNRLQTDEISVAYVELPGENERFTFSPFASAQNPEGTLFFGGEKGLIAFDPISIKTKHVPPEIVMTDFQIYNRPVEIGPDSPLKKAIQVTNRLVLSHNVDLFSLEFAILDFIAPLKSIYRCKLEGFHREWLDLGTRNFVEFTNIAPGEYRFLVTGANSEGTWTESPLALDIVIVPPFWATYWFRLLALLFVCAAIYGVYRLRLHSILKVERTRNRIARDLHDEVSATLSSTLFFARAIENKIEGKLPLGSDSYLTQIIDSTTDAQEKMKDIIWSINPENDNWDQFLSRFHRFASDLFESKNIAYDIDLKVPAATKELSMEQRHNFWLLMKEMVINAAKHSACRTVNISIEVTGRHVELVVQDDGKGFDEAGIVRRSGLRNIEKRAAMLKSEFDFSTGAGEGVRWHLKFPLE